MMDDVEEGRINCIITKDLSRFGREHVMMDYYLEFVFPEKKIRYIAVTDNEDTEKGLSDFVPFKNLFNEWFAKDTSRKVKAALRAKFNAGERIFAYAPFVFFLLLIERFVPICSFKPFMRAASLISVISCPTAKQKSS